MQLLRFDGPCIASADTSLRSLASVPRRSKINLRKSANNTNTESGNTASGSLACGMNNSSGLSTTYDAQWQAMSIIPSTGTQPSLSYPNTGISAWLCEYPPGPNVTFNNATAEGGLFFYQFTAQSQAGNSLWVNGVTNCTGTPEDVEGGVTVINTVTYGPPPQYPRA